MTQIEGTDIWQARVPFEADFIIFGSGKSDEQVQSGEIGYQTKDLTFDPIANAGQVYVVDAKPTGDNPNAKDANPTPGRGIEKTKYKYNVGEWKAYDGKFMSETIGEVPVTPVDDNSKPDDTTSAPDDTTSTPVDDKKGNTNTNTNTNTNNGSTNNGSTNNGSTNNGGNSGTSTPVNTGDATMPVAVAAVAALALGAAVIASKKKVED